MNVEDFFYRVGELAESVAVKLSRLIWGFLLPSSEETPPDFKLLRKLIKKRVTIHEFLSLKLQLAFLFYLVINLLAVVLLRPSILWLICSALPYFLYLRNLLWKNYYFFIEFAPYRCFYYGLSLIAFAAFTGYALLKTVTGKIYYYYGYLMVVFIVVLIFREAFRAKYGRDYTYGVVEEVKNDLVKVFVHDDIAANVKPGYYWVPAVKEAEPERVVKLLIKERNLRGSIPIRVLEVYLSSSQSSTEPKAETE